MKPEPNLSVQTWLDDQTVETLYLFSVTLAELLFSIATIPTGRRKEMLEQALNGFRSLFRDSMLPFDIDAAHYYLIGYDGKTWRTWFSNI